MLRNYVLRCTTTRYAVLQCVTLHYAVLKCVQLCVKMRFVAQLYYNKLCCVMYADTLHGSLKLIINRR